MLYISRVCAGCCCVKWKERWGNGWNGSEVLVKLSEPRWREGMECPHVVLAAYSSGRNEGNSNLFQSQNTDCGLTQIISNLDFHIFLCSDPPPENELYYCKRVIPRSASIINHFSLLLESCSWKKTLLPDKISSNLCLMRFIPGFHLTIQILPWGSERWPDQPAE